GEKVEPKAPHPQNRRTHGFTIADAARSALRSLTHTVSAAATHCRPRRRRLLLPQSRRQPHEELSRRLDQNTVRPRLVGQRNQTEPIKQAEPCDSNTACIW